MCYYFLEPLTQAECCLFLFLMVYIWGFFLTFKLNAAMQQEASNIENCNQWIKLRQECKACYICYQRPTLLSQSKSQACLARVYSGAFFFSFFLSSQSSLILYTFMTQYIYTIVPLYLWYGNWFTHTYKHTHTLLITIYCSYLFMMWWPTEQKNLMQCGSWPILWRSQQVSGSTGHHWSGSFPMS